MLWSDETKIKPFDHRGTACVWRKKGEATNPKNTVLTVKHGGGSIMFTVEGILKEGYVKILKENSETRH